jgi:membrane protein
MVSLVASTAITALGSYVGSYTAFGPLLLSSLNLLVSLSLFALLFGAIFKVLPDTPIAWRDVILGGFATALLFTIGKSLIGWYLGATAANSAYGAASSLFLILLWSYYSAQIFLFGAEVTRAVSRRLSRQPPRQPLGSEGHTVMGANDNMGLLRHDERKN